MGSWCMIKGFENHKYFLVISTSFDTSLSKLMLMSVWEGYESREDNSQSKGTVLEQAIKGSEILSVSCSAV